ncbi:MAG TPA: CoA-binding protein [Polyangia bacterium]|jgi:hypothetical protein|nr:CoA-binding protein [Polyangia bacterium]
MSTTAREVIDDFLAQRRIALVGASHDEKDFSRLVLRELRQRGYEVLPVNPKVERIDDLTCYPRVQDIPGSVGGAIVMTPPEVTRQVVADCVAAGIPRVWMHKGGGTGAVDEQAIELCHRQAIAVVEGECPLMFLQNTGWVHRAHAWFKKLRHTYPRYQSESHASR